MGFRLISSSLSTPVLQIGHLGLGCDLNILAQKEHTHI